MGGRGSLGGGVGISEKAFAALGAMGFNRWQKNGMDRLYISPWKAGLNSTSNRKGGIEHAWVGDYSISNSGARRLMAHKYYIDVKTKTINMPGTKSYGQVVGNESSLISDYMFNMAKKHIRGLKQSDTERR